MYNTPTPIFNHQKRPRQALFAEPQTQSSSSIPVKAQSQNKLPDLMPIHGFTSGQRFTGNQKLSASYPQNINKPGGSYSSNPQGTGREKPGIQQHSALPQHTKQAFQPQGHNAQVQSKACNKPSQTSIQNVSSQSMQQPIQPQNTQMNMSNRKRTYETPQNNKYGQSISNRNSQQRQSHTQTQRALQFGGAIPKNPIPAIATPAPSMYPSAGRSSMYNSAALVNLPPPQELSQPAGSQNRVKPEV